jgi:hypothetical protein
MKQKIISIVRKPDPTFEAIDYIPEEISDTEEPLHLIEKQELLTETATVTTTEDPLLTATVTRTEEPLLTTETHELLQTTVTPKKPTAKKIIKKKKRDDNIYDDFLVSKTNVTQVSNMVNVNQVVNFVTTTQVNNVSNVVNNEINSEVFTENYMTSSTKPIQPTLNRSIKKKKRGN